MANGKQISPIGKLTFVPIPQEGFGQTGSQLYIDESGQYFTQNKSSGNISALTGDGAIDEKIRRQYNYDFEVANTTEMPIGDYNPEGPGGFGSLGGAAGMETALTKEYPEFMNTLNTTNNAAFEAMNEIQQQLHVTPNPEASPTATTGGPQSYADWFGGSDINPYNYGPEPKTLNDRIETYKRHGTALGATDDSSINWMDMGRWKESLGEVIGNYANDPLGAGMDQLRQTNETVGFPLFSSPAIQDWMKRFLKTNRDETNQRNINTGFPNADRRQPY